MLPIEPSRPWLAPLAGFSDLPFRLLCRKFGADVACTEMISAKGLIYGSKGTEHLLATNSEDIPLVVQLFGSDVRFMAAATDQLLGKGYRYFDINCGCSVPKVVKTGAGAALLRTPDLLVELAEALVVRAGPGNVGVKLRIGWSKDDHTYDDICKRLEDVGVGWITLHPRTARQGFSGQADWNHLAAVKQGISIPVLGSGDLFTAQDGLLCLQETGIDAVMFARGALRSPRIFSDFTDLIQGRTPSPPSPSSIASMIREHARLAQKFASCRSALLKMRTIVPRYIRFLPSSKELRKDFSLCASWEELEVLVSRLEVMETREDSSAP